MTSLFVTIVAIVLFGIISLLSLTYLDVDNAKATTQAPVVALAMGNMLEAVGMYKSATESSPASLSDLNSVIDTPALPNLPGATWIISGGRVCMALPNSSFNTDLLNAAVDSMAASGLNAVFTTSSCGSVTLSNQSAIAVAI